MVVTHHCIVQRLEASMHSLLAAGSMADLTVPSETDDVLYEEDEEGEDKALNGWPQCDLVVFNCL